LNAQDPALGFWEFSGTEAQEAASMWGYPSAAQLAVTPDPQLGDNGPNMTLNHSLSSLGIIPNVTVADIMDTKGGYLCYEYE
jgi:tyrosinase